MTTTFIQLRADLQLPQSCRRACSATVSTAPPVAARHRHSAAAAWFTGLLGAAALAPASCRPGRATAWTWVPKSRFVGVVSAEEVEAVRAGSSTHRRCVEAAQQRGAGAAGAPAAASGCARSPSASFRFSYRVERTRAAVEVGGESAGQTRQLNAFCMPGGKIAFFYGILEKLRLEDDEVAAIMGHEVAHALREHARERDGQVDVRPTAIVAARLGAAGPGQPVGRGLANMGAQLAMTLRFSREDETEADLVGIELAARAGYDPAAAVRLWQKMMAANKGAPPQWLSTHPASGTRIQDIQANLPRRWPACTPGRPRKPRAAFRGRAAVEGRRRAEREAPRLISPAGRDEPNRAQAGPLGACHYQRAGSTFRRWYWPAATRLQVTTQLQVLDQLGHHLARAAQALRHALMRQRQMTGRRRWTLPSGSSAGRRRRSAPAAWWTAWRRAHGG